MIKNQGIVAEVPVLCSVDFGMSISIVSKRVFDRRPARLCCIEEINVGKINKLGSRDV